MHGAPPLLTISHSQKNTIPTGSNRPIASIVSDFDCHFYPESHDKRKKKKKGKGEGGGEHRGGETQTTLRNTHQNQKADDPSIPLPPSPFYRSNGFPRLFPVRIGSIILSSNWVLPSTLITPYKVRTNNINLFNAIYFL